MEAEVAFGLDLDDDGFVGKDSSGNGAFDDADLTLVEDFGSLESYTDITGAIYGKSAVDDGTDAIDTPILYKGKALTTTTFKGFDFMGLDSYVEGEATINAVIYQKSNGSNSFKYMELGSGTDFEYVKSKSSDDILKSVSGKKFTQGTYEDTFVQELDGIV